LRQFHIQNLKVQYIKNNIEISRNAFEIAINDNDWFEKKYHLSMASRIFVDKVRVDMGYSNRTASVDIWGGFLRAYREVMA
jgi:hypothetical protein